MSKGHVVVDGAICKCKFGYTPDVLVVQSQQKIYGNDGNGSKKLVANTMDLGMPLQAKSFGNCKLKPSSSGHLPCIPSVTQWQSPYENVTLPNQGKILTEESKATCPTAGSPCIEFTWHGQTAVPSSSAVATVNEDVQNQLNPLVNVSANEQPEAKLTICSVDEDGEPEQFFVDAIDIQNLHEGIKNSEEANDKKGMIYGEEYILKVTNYRNNTPPKDFNTIKWAYEYKKDDEIIVGEISGKGEKVTFKANDLDFCGRYFTFYAYIESKENEASKKVFHHYRFRWFDRKKIVDQISVRKQTPKVISQNSTSLCGIAALMYSFIKMDNSKYEEFALTLHRKGVATNNSYEIKPETHFFETSPEDEDYPENWKGKMPLVDWVVMASIRNNENSLYDGKDGEDFDAINWPWVMEHLSNKFIGATDIKDNTYAISNFYEDKSFELQEMKRLHDGGYQVMMMIDGDMIDNEPSTVGFVNHWVSFVGNYIYDTVNEKHSFKIFTWGGTKTLNISKKAFNTNSYGYIAIK